MFLTRVCELGPKMTLTCYAELTPSLPSLVENTLLFKDAIFSNKSITNSRLQPHILNFYEFCSNFKKNLTFYCFPKLYFCIQNRFSLTEKLSKHRAMSVFNSTFNPIKVVLVLYTMYYKIIL